MAGITPSEPSNPAPNPDVTSFHMPGTPARSPPGSRTVSPDGGACDTAGTKGGDSSAAAGAAYSPPKQRGGRRSLMSSPTLSRGSSPGAGMQSARSFMTVKSAYGLEGLGLAASMGDMDEMELPENNFTTTRKGVRFEVEVRESAGSNRFLGVPRFLGRLLFRNRADVKLSAWGKMRGLVHGVGALNERAVQAKVFGKDSKKVERHIRRIYQLRVPYMIHPEAGWRRHWNIVLGLLVVLTLFWTPFELAFDFTASFEDDATPGQVFWGAVEVFMLTFFTVDIMLNFRTAIYEDGDLIQDPKEVASQYVRTWFGLDLIATFPFDTVVSALASGSLAAGEQLSVTLPRLLRFLRLIKLTRVLRILKLKKLLDQMDEMSVFANHVIRFMRIGFYMIVIAHILGCGWYFVGSIAVDAGDLNESWLWRYNLVDAPVETQYTQSLYWAFVTVTTVGYGDITPTSNRERLFVVVCTFVGNMAFAFMVGKITALAYQVDATTNVFQEKMDAVNEFMKYREVPREMRKRVRAFYESFWGRGIHFNESKILGELSFSLRREVAHFLNRDIIRSVPIFKGANERFTDEFISLLRPLQSLPGDEIMSAGDRGRDMFILRKGAVMISPLEGTTHTLTDGSFFGEIPMVFEQLRRTATATSVVATELAALSKSGFKQLCRNYPNFQAVMKVVALARLEAHCRVGHEQDPIVAATALIREFMDTQKSGLFKRADSDVGLGAPGAETPGWLRKVQLQRSYKKSEVDESNRGEDVDAGDGSDADDSKATVESSKADDSKASEVPRMTSVPSMPTVDEARAGPPPATAQLYAVGSEAFVRAGEAGSPMHTSSVVTPDSFEDFGVRPRISLPTPMHFDAADEDMVAYTTMIQSDPHSAGGLRNGNLALQVSQLRSEARRRTARLEQQIGTLAADVHHLTSMVERIAERARHGQQ